MQAGQSSKTLTIAAPRDFTAKWLGRRLADYGRHDPELRFVLLNADDDLGFTQANLDLAVRMADGPGEHEGVALGAGGDVLVAGADIEGSAADALIGWPGASAEEGQPVVTVADAGLAIDAAAAGFGRAIVPAMLAEADIAGGRVRQIGEVRPAEQSYWLIAPLPQWRQKKVRALVAALAA